LSITSALLDGGEWSASRPSRINPREKALLPICKRGWVGHTAGLHAVAKRKEKSFTVPARNQTPVVQPDKLLC